MYNLRGCDAELHEDCLQIGVAFADGEAETTSVFNCVDWVASVGTEEDES